jgi:hypothetical protein
MNALRLLTLSVVNVPLFVGALWMADNIDLEPGNAVSAFLVLLGGSLVAVGLEIPGIAEADDALTFAKLFIGLTIFALGMRLFFAAYHWKSKLRPWLSPRFAALTESVAQDSQYFFIGLAGFLVFGNFLLVLEQRIAVLAIGRELGELRVDVTRYLVPRHLTLEQSSKITAYLLKHSPQQFTFNVIKNDREADEYRAEMDITLENGGWKMTGINFVDDALEGISIQSKVPLVSSRDRNRPFNGQILEKALKQGQIQIDASGSTSSDRDAPVLIIIGHRRRDDQGIVTQPIRPKED